jgi:hypothetical protein
MVENAAPGLHRHFSSLGFYSKVLQLRHSEQLLDVQTHVPQAAELLALLLKRDTGSSDGPPHCLSNRLLFGRFFI